MISNLHSLLSSKWMIEQSLISSFFPLLESVISNGKVSVSEQPTPFLCLSSGVTVEGNYYSDTNDSNQEKYVAVVPIKSTIYKYNQECGPRGTKHHQKTIQSYINDPMCIAVVLDIDSGGGQVAGTPDFYDFLKNASKPIHTYTDGLLCSAAYYIASGTKSITANQYADAIGSIGTMISFIDFTGYYEKQGAKVITEYATKSDGKNRAYRDLLAGNPETYIKQELDPITDTFIDNVKATRKAINEVVFDGSTYNSQDALAYGLIDKIGTMSELIDSIFQESKQSSTNSNLNMKMSNHAKIMGVIGVAALAMTDKGSYFNEENLNALEGALTTAETEKEQLTAELATANQATQTANETIAGLQSATEQATIQATAFVSKIATSLGLEASATEQEIDARIAEVAKGPGANHNNPQGNEKPKDQAESFIDKNASHNQLANQI